MEEIPETALARPLSLETTPWTLDSCCVEMLLVLDEISPTAVGHCHVPRGSTISNVSSLLFHAFETLAFAPVHVSFRQSHQVWSWTSGHLLL